LFTDLDKGEVFGEIAAIDRGLRSARHRSPRADTRRRYERGGSKRISEEDPEAP